MLAEQNKAVVRRLIYELFNRTDLSVADEIIAAGYVDHDPVPGEASGREGLRQLGRSLRSAFPNGHFAINDQVAEGDRVVTRWAFWGTHFGEFAHISATSEEVWFTAITVHRIADGKIHEGWTGFEQIKWGKTSGTVLSLLRKARVVKNGHILA
jgi:predicted ester cyclase